MKRGLAVLCLSTFPAFAQDASKLDNPCRPTYESVMLLLLEQNCADYVEMTAAGHKFQLTNGKKNVTMDCVAPATDTIKSEMDHVAQSATSLGMQPTELWCTEAIGMFHDTPEHETWIKVLK